ncbi:MAG: RES domain-containing protein [Verrucomicrobiia bacterium]
MALNSRLPPPPADLATRKLPLVTISDDLFRIHQTIHKWRYFRRNKSERFDDPHGVFGVLYGSTTAEAAFAEVFLRKLASMSVAQVDLQSRAVSTFNAGPLTCVELTGSGLRRLWQMAAGGRASCPLTSPGHADPGFPDCLVGETPTEVSA